MSIRIQEIMSDVSGFKGIDLGCHSIVWDLAARPSEAFVVPFVGTTQGFELLHTVIYTGHTDAVNILIELQPVVDKLQVESQRTVAIFNKVEEAVIRLEKHLQFSTKHNQPGIEEDEFSLTKHLILHKEAYIGHLKMSDQSDAAFEYYDTCIGLIETLELLYKIWGALNNIHKQYGAGHAKDRAAVAKLTVAMKCLDSAWADMRMRYWETKEAEEAEAYVEHYEFPFGDFAEYDF